MTGLTGLARPFIVGVVTERTPHDARASIGAAVREGAEAIEVNLPALGHVSAGTFRSLRVSAVALYTSCRRPDFMKVYGIEPASCPAWTEEQRMIEQLHFLAAGSVAIDMEMDTYDPKPSPPLGTEAAERAAATFGPPMELSHQASAVARQRETIGMVKELGGEVIVSCHTGRRQTTEQLVELVDTAIDRGADLVKVVSPCPEPRDFAELQRAGATLAESRVPFALVGAGEVGSPSRSFGSDIPSSWYIGRPSVQSHAYSGQPLISMLWEGRRALSN